MERYNSFQLIHKGLRAALYQTAHQLQCTDFTQEPEAEEALNKVKEIVLLFDGHAHKEDKFVLPLINAYEPSVVATFEAEHVTDIRLGEQLSACVAAVENAGTAKEQLRAGQLLTEAFVEFMVFNLNHMAREEDIINRILWRYYSDDEIRQIGTRIAQATEPWMHALYATWMLRGINHTETVTWMKAIERGMPPVVFQSLVQKAGEELPKQRFVRMKEALIG